MEDQTQGKDPWAGLCRASLEAHVDKYCELPERLTQQDCAGAEGNGEMCGHAEGPSPSLWAVGRRKCLSDCLVGASCR